MAGTRMNRQCLACGHKGEMKTWLGNYNGAQLIMILLLFCYLVPGIIFIAWAWGKYKCPKCGALGKNVVWEDNPLVQEEKKIANTPEEFIIECFYCEQKMEGDSEECPRCHTKVPEHLKKVRPPELIHQPTTKKCPLCAEEIKFEAIKCKHCGSMLEGTTTA